MKRKSKILQVRVDEDMARSWKYLASSRTMNQSELSRKVINIVLKNNPQSRASPTFTTQAGEREQEKKEVKIRLTQSELSSLTAMAASWGLSRQQYLISLLRSSLINSSLVSKEEIDTLLSVAAEIRKIGINLNQIARKINQENAANGRLSSESIPKAINTIESTKQVIDQSIHRIESFLSLNRSRGKITTD